PSTHLSFCVFFLCTLRLPPTPPLFPYTTLFRPSRVRAGRAHAANRCVRTRSRGVRARLRACVQPRSQRGDGAVEGDGRGASRQRSEEHTSELQSRENLVCRLLLEKKKTTRHPYI